MIQPHGMLLALQGREHRVTQVSENLPPLLGLDVGAVLGRPLVEVLGAEIGGLLAPGLSDPSLDRRPRYLHSVLLPPDGQRRPFQAIAHRLDGHVVLELEAATSAHAVSFPHLDPMVRAFIAGLEEAADVKALGQLAAEEVRRITGFDRVLVCRFDRDWHGHVVAEDRKSSLPSYLDRWFPASDISPQARELYRINRIQLIADRDSRPVPLVPPLSPSSGKPLDLSFAGLRGVAPAQVEYLRNMGVVGSMSISIVREGELWGLIGCYHETPRHVPFEIRAACDLLGQVLSIQLGIRETAAETARRLELKSLESRLLAAMAEEENIVDGIIRRPTELLGFTGAAGAAVLFDGRCHLIGETPSEERVRGLVDWLVEQGQPEVYATDSVPAALPDADAYRERASGILAIAISKIYRSYVVWFRPEAVRTVEWSGDPRRPASVGPDGEARLQPRTSFDRWRETVRGQATPWDSASLAAAVELRTAIVGIVLRKAEELAQLSAELTRANQELEAFSYSVSHDLRAPFRHIVGYSELLRERLSGTVAPEVERYINTIIESAHFAGSLVDNLLSFSQIGRSSLHPTTVNLGRLVDEVRAGLMGDAGDRDVEWRIGELPAVEADAMMLRLVVQNLLANALKYTRPRRPARIEVSAAIRDREVVVAVRDNGVGFDMQYVDKLFGVFQRLHRMEEFEGTGIGLANVRRIVARHGGRTWAEGAVGAGATFYFSLPRWQPEPEAR